MVLVAVAGGTSPTLGRSIAQALVGSKNHEAVVLSRAKDGTDTASTTDKAYGASIRYVDYSNIEHLVASLQGVHTLVSVLKVLDPNVLVRQHENLLVACSQAGVKRFIMSDWALGPASHSAVELLAPKAQIAQICAAENARKQGSAGTGELEGKLNPNNIVECSTVQVGAFMNYYVQNYDKTGRDPNLDGGLVDDLMLEVLDVAKDVLYIPVPSNSDKDQGSSISLTDINDIGPLIAAAMDLPPGKLQGMIGCVSQTTTFGHVRDILAAKCGKTLNVTIMTKEDFVQLDTETKEAFEKKMQQSGEFDVDLFKRRMVMQIYALYSEPKINGGVVEPKLNQLLTEAGLNVKTRKVEDLLVGAWA